MTGADALLQRLGSMAQKAGEAAEKAASFAAGRALEEAKKRAPVRTGYLRSSIGQHQTGALFRVKTGCSYALYVEKGTRYMRPRAYLTPAFRKAARPDEMVRVFREELL